MFIIQRAMGAGVIDALPEEEKRKLTGLITYLISEDSVRNLEDTLENAHLISISIKQAAKDVYLRNSNEL